MSKMNVCSKLNVKCRQKRPNFRFSSILEGEGEGEGGKIKNTILCYVAHDAVNVKMQIRLPFRHSLLLACLNTLHDSIFNIPGFMRIRQFYSGPIRK